MPADGCASSDWGGLLQAEHEFDVTAIEPPSQVDKVESLRRRATVLRAAGQATQAATLERPLREALLGQHEASPRRAWSAVGQ
jgi:hypothetical protein